MIPVCIYLAVGCAVALGCVFLYRKALVLDDSMDAVLLSALAGIAWPLVILGAVCIMALGRVEAARAKESDAIERDVEKGIGRTS